MPVPYLLTQPYSFLVFSDFCINNDKIFIELLKNTELWNDKVFHPYLEKNLNPENFWACSLSFIVTFKKLRCWRKFVSNLGETEGGKIMPLKNLTLVRIDFYWISKGWFNQRDCNLMMSRELAIPGLLKIAILKKKAVTSGGVSWVQLCFTCVS